MSRFLIILQEVHNIQTTNYLKKERASASLCYYKQEEN